MIQPLRATVVFAFLSCLLRPAHAQTPAPVPELSADDTVTYINKTLHEYPATEFVASGCHGDQQVLAISSDRRSLIITETLPRKSEGTCELETITAPIFSLDRYLLGSRLKHGQHSSFDLYCAGTLNCFRRYPPNRPAPSYATMSWSLMATAPDDVSVRLTKAVRHLVSALLIEQEGRTSGDDAFAQKPH